MNTLTKINKIVMKSLFLGLCALPLNIFAHGEATRFIHMVKKAIGSGNFSNTDPLLCYTPGHEYRLGKEYYGMLLFGEQKHQQKRLKLARAMAKTMGLVYKEFDGKGLPDVKLLEAFINELKEEKPRVIIIKDAHLFFSNFITGPVFPKVFTKDEGVGHMKLWRNLTNALNKSKKVLILESSRRDLIDYPFLSQMDVKKEL